MAAPPVRFSLKNELILNRVRLLQTSGVFVFRTQLKVKTRTAHFALHSPGLFTPVTMETPQINCGHQS